MTASRLKARATDAVVWTIGKAAYLALDLFGWRFISRAGGVLGILMHLMAGHRRGIVHKELGLLLGMKDDDPKLRGMVKRTFVNYYKKQLETVYFGRVDRAMVERHVRAEGLEHIDQGLARGKGVIMLLAHYGSYLLPLPYLGHSGFRVNQITGRQIHDSLFAERFWAWRQCEAARLPVRFRQVDKFLRPVYDALKNNEIVAIAFEGRDSTKWESVRFLSRTARFSHGSFELARRTGAAIVPTFIVRGADDSHTIYFEPLFELSSDADPSRAAADDTQRFADIFARYVEQHPCHFAMALQYHAMMRLRSKPEGALFID